MGDSKRDALIAGHLWIADDFAKWFSRRGCGDYDELYGVASLALVEAARKYDPGIAAFAGYAKLWVDGAIRRHARKARKEQRPDDIPLGAIKDGDEPSAPRDYVEFDVRLERRAWDCDAVDYAVVILRLAG